MVEQKAKELAAEIRASEEFNRYVKAREAVAGSGMTKSLLEEYRRLRVKAQADAVAGGGEPETLEKLQKLGELLQMDRAASEYLMAEFMLHRMVGEVYRTLAEAAELDLSMLE